jgi:hypothetical protein
MGVVAIIAFAVFAYKVFHVYDRWLVPDYLVTWREAMTLNAAYRSLLDEQRIDLDATSAPELSQLLIDRLNDDSFNAPWGDYYRDRALRSLALGIYRVLEPGGRDGNDPVIESKVVAVSPTGRVGRPAVTRAGNGVIYVDGTLDSDD